MAKAGRPASHGGDCGSRRGSCHGAVSHEVVSGANRRPSLARRERVAADSGRVREAAGLGPRDAAEDFATGPVRGARLPGVRPRATHPSPAPRRDETAAALAHGTGDLEERDYWRRRLAARHWTFARTLSARTCSLRDTRMAKPGSIFRRFSIHDLSSCYARVAPQIESRGRLAARTTSAAPQGASSSHLLFASLAHLANESLPRFRPGARCERRQGDAGQRAPRFARYAYVTLSAGASCKTGILTGGLPDTASRSPPAKPVGCSSEPPSPRVGCAGASPRTPRWPPPSPPTRRPTRARAPSRRRPGDGAFPSGAPCGPAGPVRGSRWCPGRRR